MKNYIRQAELSRNLLKNECLKVSFNTSNSLDQYFKETPLNNSESSFGEILPYILSDIMDVKLGNIEKIGWAAIYFGTTILDDLLDNASDFSNSLLLTNFYLLSLGQNLLQRNIKNEYQDRFLDCIRESLKFEIKDLHSFNNILPVEDINKIAKGKNSFIYIFSFLLASKAPQKSEQIFNLTDSLLNFVQTLDDLKDLEEDFKLGNFNSILARSESFSSFDDSVTDISEVLINEGLLENVLTELHVEILSFISIIEFKSESSPGVNYFIEISEHLKNVLELLHNIDQTDSPLEILEKVKSEISIIAQSS